MKIGDCSNLPPSGISIASILKGDTRDLFYLRNLEETLLPTDPVCIATIIECSDSAAEESEMTELTLKNHPIMVTLQDSISGNGFLARITMSGRGLMRKEEDGRWWMYGIRPAAIAASGENIDEAFREFCASYWAILADVAQETSNFSEFERAVKRFFEENDADNEDERAWESALAYIRASSCEPPPPFSKLPRRSPEESPSFIRIERVDAEAKDIRLIPSENVPDVYAYALPKAA